MYLLSRPISQLSRPIRCTSRAIKTKVLRPINSRAINSRAINSRAINSKSSPCMGGVDGVILVPTGVAAERSTQFNDALKGVAEYVLRFTRQLIQVRSEL